MLSLEEKKLEIASEKRISSKLPKLQVTKFQGLHLDWVRFWGPMRLKLMEHQ